jgi:hypothetical protein
LLNGTIRHEFFRVSKFRHLAREDMRALFMLQHMRHWFLDMFRSNVCVIYVLNSSFSPFLVQEAAWVMITPKFLYFVTRKVNVLKLTENLSSHWLNRVSWRWVYIWEQSRQRERQVVQILLC